MFSWKRLLLMFAWCIGAGVLAVYVFPLSNYTVSINMDLYQYFYWRWHTEPLFIYDLSPFFFGIYLSLVAVRRWKWNPNLNLLMLVCLPTAIVTILVGYFIVWSDGSLPSKVANALIGDSESVPLLPLLCGFSLINGLFEGENQGGKGDAWRHLAWCVGAFVPVLILSPLLVGSPPEQILIDSICCGLYLGMFSVRSFKCHFDWTFLVGVFFPLGILYAAMTITANAYVPNLYVQPDWWTSGALASFKLTTLFFVPIAVAFALIRGIWGDADDGRRSDLNRVKPGINWSLVIAIVLAIILGVVFFPPQVQRFQATQAAIKAAAIHDHVTNGQIQIDEVQFHPALGKNPATWIFLYKEKQNGKWVPSDGWYGVDVSPYQNGWEAYFDSWGFYPLPNSHLFIK